MLGHLQALVDKALYESQAEMNCFNEITESNHLGFPLPVCERGEAMLLDVPVYMVPVLSCSQKPQINTLVHLQAHSP